MSDAAASALNAATRLCAVLGRPIRHSASPAMHNAAFAALGLNWRYAAFDVEPAALPEAIRGAQALGLCGLNLTVPHKILAVELVDALDASAQTWGAVNTIRFEGRAPGGPWQPLREFTDAPPPETRSHGFNTDADAIVRDLRESLGLELAGRRVLLLGAGGAGRTAALRLATENIAELFLVNRTAAKAEALAREIAARCPAVRVQLGHPGGAVDLVLNATSLGLAAGDAPPWDERQFPLARARAVYDMIYRPAETPLLQAAKAAGCRTANGLGMLLHQGAAAFELWTGRPAPLDVMRRALESNVYGR